MSKQLTEECPFCGDDFIKLSSHLRHCKKNPANLTESEQQEKEEIPVLSACDPAPTEKKKSSIFGFLKKKHDAELQPPTKPLTLAEKLNEKEIIDDLTEEEKFLRFFAESQSWSIEPPKLSIFSKIKQFFFPSDIEYKKCVFVSEDTEAKYGYYPYDPKNQFLFLPDGRTYSRPQAGDTWFFNADKHLPLIQSKNLEDIYDLPNHYVTAVHNDGIQYGQTMGFNDLINSIKSTTILIKIMAGVTIITIVAAAIIVKQTSGDVATLAAEINAMRTILTGGTA